MPQLDGSATPDDTFAMVDGHGTVLEVAGLRPTRAQRALAAAVGDPAPFAAAPEPRDLTLNGASYRATASRLDDGTYVLFASSTDALDNGIHKALKLDLTVGGCCWRCWPSSPCSRCGVGCGRWRTWWRPPRRSPRAT